MSKRNKIIYRIATVWLSLGMLSSGIVQLLNIKSETDFILQLGYPVYFLTILGIWKILGVVAVLIPNFPLVKEWAYAGFFFTMTGALYSQIAMGNAFGEICPPILLIVLTVVSWYFRQADRKVISSNK